jgi:hypothetical protein
MTQPDPGRQDTHLHGRLRLVVQAGWLVLAALLLTPFAAGVPVRLRHLQTMAGEPGVPLVRLIPAPLEAVYTLRLGPAEVEALHGLGLSLRFYAAYVIAFDVALALVCTLTAAFIFWRRRDDWMTLLVALILVLLGTNSVSPVVSTLATVWTGRALDYVTLAYNGAAALGMLTHVHILFLSPDGRFVPRWTQPLAAAFSGVVLALGAYAVTTITRWGQLSSALVLSVAPAWLILIGLGVISQVYRYRRVSSTVQRQQTKWVVVGLSGMTLGFVLNASFLSLASQQAGLPRLVINLVHSPLVYTCLLLLPICLAFSILRYRLWDIDLIIRRTLIYSSLTAALALVYLGSVVLLQSLFGLLTGERQPEFVTVLSTLAIAALFIPLRRRVQNGIDRLFYRRKYDAAQTLAAFSTGLRHDAHADLERLGQRLVSAVDETMQPEHVSLWLRPQPKVKTD